MPHQILLCIVHLFIWCTIIFLLIAIVSLIKSKLNNFLFIFYFLFLKLVHLNWIRPIMHLRHRTNSASSKFQISSSLSLQNFRSISSSLSLWRTIVCFFNHYLVCATTTILRPLPGSPSLRFVFQHSTEQSE
jgi:hypothetical protein